jgi:autophagy-related protein 16
VETDDATAVSGHMDGGLRFWDLRSGHRTADITGLHEGGITSVQFHPHVATQVLTNGKDATVKLVDIRTGTALQTMRHDDFRSDFNSSVCCLSPDGKVHAVYVSLFVSRFVCTSRLIII